MTVIDAFARAKDRLEAFIGLCREKNLLAQDPIPSVMRPADRWLVGRLRITKPAVFLSFWYRSFGCAQIARQMLRFAEIQSNRHHC